MLPCRQSVFRLLAGISAAALIGVGAGLFLFLAHEVREEPGRRLEDRALALLRDPGDLARPRGPAWLRRAALDLTSLGGTATLTLLCAGTAGYFLLHRRWAPAAAILATGAGGAAVSASLKSWIGRARPSVVPHLVDAPGFSFPSGHSFLATAVFLTLAILLARTIPSFRGKAYAVGMAAGAALLVGLTRIYLGVHYPSDVLAGWCGGLAWALLCHLAVPRFSAPRRMTKLSSFSPQPAPGTPDMEVGGNGFPPPTKGSLCHPSAASGRLRPR